MRESETRKGEPQIGPLLYAGRKAVRTADDQGQFALFPHDLGERGGQFFGGKHFPLHAKGNDKSVRGEQRKNRIGLFFKGCGDFGGAGIFGQPAFLQFADGKAGKGRKAFFIFGCGLAPIALFQVAGDDQMNAKHGCLRCNQVNSGSSTKR